MDISKRGFLKRSLALFTATGLAGATKDVAAVEPPDVPPWMKSPGAGLAKPSLAFCITASSRPCCCPHSVKSRLELPERK